MCHMTVVFFKKKKVVIDISMVTPHRYANLSWGIILVDCYSQLKKEDNVVY